MEKTTELPTFLKADDKTLIHTHKIRWVKHYKECMYICLKSNDCHAPLSLSTHEVCKKHNLESYLALHKLFA
jgi:hypothetical protein